MLKNGTLYIKEVHREDENNYGCTAGNSAGLNRKEVHLLVHSASSKCHFCKLALSRNYFLAREGFHPGEGENEDGTVTKALLITMSVAAAYIFLVVGLMVWCRYRRKSRKLPITDGWYSHHLVSDEQ